MHFTVYAKDKCGIFASRLYIILEFLDYGILTPNQKWEISNFAIILFLKSTLPVGKIYHNSNMRKTCSFCFCKQVGEQILCQMIFLAKVSRGSFWLRSNWVRLAVMVNLFFPKVPVFTSSFNQCQLIWPMNTLESWYLTNQWIQKRQVLELPYGSIWLCQ